MNVSNCGALVEGNVRLLPGRHLDVHVVTRDGRVLVRCRVARSFVCRLAFDGLWYRSALAFERNVDAASGGQQVPVFEPIRAPALSSGYPEPHTSVSTDAAANAPA